MSDYNRDVNQQFEMSQKLKEYSKDLSGIVSSLENMLKTMDNAVDDPTTSAAVGRIKAVVDKISPNVGEISDLATKVEQQATAGKAAQDELAKII